MLRPCCRARRCSLLFTSSSRVWHLLRAARNYATGPSLEPISLPVASNSRFSSSASRTSCSTRISRSSSTSKTRRLTEQVKRKRIGPVRFHVPTDHGRAAALRSQSATSNPGRLDAPPSFMPHRECPTSRGSIPRGACSLTRACYRIRSVPYSGGLMRASRLRRLGVQLAAVGTVSATVVACGGSGHRRQAARPATVSTSTQATSQMTSTGLASGPSINGCNYAVPGAHLVRFAAVREKLRAAVAGRGRLA